ncbi:MAG: reverse transcriptase domain-containing protein, partial [Dehalococcoidales bacterium]|nr:reverse transcriptase domain-containing protein [Dehalococcoidales bacterium]
NLLNRLTVSRACMGFEKDTSILDNAKPHIGAVAIMSLDIDDFFPSIKANRVWSIFRTIGYNPQIANVLTSLCTFKGSLPQGSPASPKLSNLISIRLDARLLGYAGKHGIIYTRYADDLCFSSLSYDKLAKSYPFFCNIIESEGFILNDRKTRFVGAARQHQVTGLVVTDKQVGIGRIKLKQIRAKINHLCESSSNSAPKNSLEHIIGWLSFIKDVDNTRYSMVINYIMKLQNKYPESAVNLLLIKR